MDCPTGIRSANKFFAEFREFVAQFYRQSLREKFRFPDPEIGIELRAWKTIIARLVDRIDDLRPGSPE